jgi:lipoate-protein ligase A
MGVGQRIVRGAAHTGGVIVVGASDRVRGVLGPVYEALGFDYDPATTGSVEDEIGPVRFEDVRDALLAELETGRALRAVQLDPATLEQAERFEPSLRIPETPA